MATRGNLRAKEDRHRAYPVGEYVDIPFLLLLMVLLAVGLVMLKA